MKKDKLDRAFDDLIDVIDQKNLKNYVAIVLDRSGSMQNMRREAVDMFNEQVDALQKSTGEMKTFVSLVTFASQVDEPEIWCEDVAKFPKFSHSDYNPKGGTALRDAIGKTIQKFESMDASKDPNSSFLIIAITDGDENSSIDFSSSRLAELIQSMQETKRWTFSYIGTDRDFSKITKETNIHIGNVMACSYASSSMSSGPSRSPSMSSNISRGIDNYMSGRAMGMTSTNNMYEGCVSNENITVGNADNTTKEEEKK